MRSLTVKIVQGASYVQVKHKVGVVSFELQVPPAELNGGIMGYKHRSESYQAWCFKRVYGRATATQAPTLCT
jgi:hypothetical protein